MEHCSFCGSNSDQGVIIALSQEREKGICNECITLCAKVINEFSENDLVKVCKKEKANCSFCGKNLQEVEHLIHGPAGSVHICNNCIRSVAEGMINYLE